MPDSGSYRIRLHEIVGKDSGTAEFPEPRFLGSTWPQTEANIHRLEFLDATSDEVLAIFDLVFLPVDWGHRPSADSQEPQDEVNPNYRQGAKLRRNGAKLTLEGALLPGLRVHRPGKPNLSYADLIPLQLKLTVDDSTRQTWKIAGQIRTVTIDANGPLQWSLQPTLAFQSLAELEGNAIPFGVLSSLDNVEPDVLQPFSLHRNSPQWREEMTATLTKEPDASFYAFQFERRLKALGRDKAAFDAAGRPGEVKLYDLGIAKDHPIAFTLRQPAEAVRIGYRVLNGRKHLDWLLTVDDVPVQHLERFFDLGIARPYLEALIRVRDGHRISLLPTLTYANQAVTAGRLRLQYVATDTIAHLSYLVEAQSVDEFTPPLSASTRDRWQVWPLCVSSTRIGPVTFLLDFPGLRAHDGRSLAREMKLLSIDGVAATGFFDAESKLTFKALLPGPKNKPVRMGALDLTFAEEVVPEKEDLRITAWSVAADWPRDHSRQSDAWSSNVHRLSVEATFELFDARPGAQDPLPDQLFSSRFTLTTAQQSDDTIRRREQRIEDALARPPALVIDRGAAAKQVRFLLVGAERVEIGASQAVDLRLQLRGWAATGTLSTVVIDERPFTVALVEMDALGSAAGVNGDVGNWSLSEMGGAFWELGGITEGFTLYFPPQALGEETAKPVVGPIGDGAIDYRLSPSAKLTLSSSYWDQNFKEAPWNLRRVLGYAGERAPGAGIKNARFELLYGLQCDMQPAFTFLSEMTARLGSLPQPLLPRLRNRADGSDDAIIGPALEGFYQARRELWAQQIAAYNRRLAVFEMWREGATDKAFSLDTGVNFEIRDSAEMAYPISPEILPPDTKWTGLLAEAWRDPQRRLLKGGALWGFESPNVLKELLQNLKSTAGFVSKIGFSALGGWGYQKASFSRNKTRIYADTSMGRAHFYSVERIGRIGCFWNRAKHVVIYRRSVLPSAQFWPPNPNEVQPGRPLLRKLEEYVELLEPRRQYPEGSESPMSAGMHRATEFKTVRIPVDSSWGRDIDGGWVIPLWSPSAPPSIYPKPLVHAVHHGDPDGLAETINAPFAEPHGLLFYTSTDPSLDDRTDLWPPVPGVDFIDRPAPEPDTQAPIDANDPDACIADAAEIDDDHAALTFRLDPPAIPVNLVAGRAAKAMNFVPHNVTFMRGKPRSSGLSEASQIVVTAADLRRAFEAGAKDIVAAIAADDNGKALGDSIAQARAKAAQLKQTIANYTRDMAAAAGANLNPYLKDDANLKKTLCDAFKDQLNAAIDLYVEAVVGDVADAVDKLAIDLADAKDSAVEAAVAQITHAKITIQVLFRPFKLAIGDAKTEITTAIGRLKDDAQSGVRGLDAWINDAKGEIDKALAEANPDGIRSAIDDIRSRSDAAIEAVDRALRSAGGGEFGGLATTYSDSLKELTSESRKDFGIIADAMRQGQVDLPALVATCKTQLDAIGAYATVHVATPLGDIARMIADQVEIKPGVDNFAKAAKAFADFVAGTEFDRGIAAVLAGQNATVTKLVDAIKSFAARLRAYGAPGGGGRTALKQAAGTAMDALCDMLFAVGKQVLERIGDLPAIAQSLEDIVNGTIPGVDTAEKLREKLDSVFKEKASDLLDLDRRLVERLTLAGQAPSFRDPDGTLRLIRAFGEAPVVPDLKFNRERMAYFFDDARQAIETSPAAALYNRASEDLKALGLRVPTRELLDHVIPAELQNFDVSNIFSDLAGIKFASLFPDLKLPQIANNQVRIAHGFDKVSQTGWVRADVDVPFASDAKIFSIGPLELYLDEARLTAHADVTTRLGGTPQKDISGKITGDWELSLGGTTLMTFVQTSVTFDNSGELNFDIRPDQVKLDEALQWLSELVAMAGEPDSGFTVEMLAEGGLPCGVRCVLNLPLPPYGAGAFAISGLVLGARFEVYARPAPNGVTFYLAVGMNLGRKTMPFTLTIAFLNGGGWLDASAKYFPNDGRISTHVTIGIVAGAGAEFSVGPFYGGVYVQFGIFVEFYADDPSNHDGMTVGIMLLVRGGASFYGMVTISVVLLLQATYSEGGKLVGTGTLSASVKICWCVTLSASVAVQYVLAGGGGGHQQAMAMPAAGAQPALAIREDLFDGDE